MGPERPSGCGAIAISEYIPRSCRAGYSGDGRCIRSQCGNTGCKAANHFFNTPDFRNEPGYALNECNFATYTNISLIFYSIVLARNPVPSRSRREPLGEPILEEEASNEETRIRSVARTCHENKWETPKVDCRHLDKEKPEAIVHGKTPCTFEQEMA